VNAICRDSIIGSANVFCLEYAFFPFLKFVLHCEKGGLFVAAEGAWLLRMYLGSKAYIEMFLMKTIGRIRR